jgi:3-deoxy-manno-octulosonate cytidylyltransferase (CMP-KDO synthetase)
VVVAADDEALCEVARRWGAETVLTRADHKSGTDRIAEAAEGMDEEFIVNVQGDEPEVEPSHVLAAARLLEGTSDAMGTLAYPLTDEAAFRNPNLVKVVVDGNGHALYFSRAPIPFPRRPANGVDATAGPREGSVEGAWGLAHMGIYVYRREFLLSYSSLPPSALERREKLEQLRALEAGERIRVAVVGPPRGAPIDTREAYEEFCRRAASPGCRVHDVNRTTRR